MAIRRWAGDRAGDVDVWGEGVGAACTYVNYTRPAASFISVGPGSFYSADYTFLFTELWPNIGWRGRRLPHQFRPSTMAFYSVGGTGRGAAVLAFLILASISDRCASGGAAPVRLALTHFRRIIFLV